MLCSGIRLRETYEFKAKVHTSCNPSTTSSCSPFTLPSPRIFIPRRMLCSGTKLRETQEFKAKVHTPCTRQQAARVRPSSPHATQHTRSPGGGHLFKRVHGKHSSAGLIPTTPNRLSIATRHLLPRDNICLLNLTSEQERVRPSFSSASILARPSPDTRGAP